MRTTVTINDNLLERAKERARAEGLTLGDFVEQSLQRCLALPEQVPGPPLPVFRGGGGFAPGIDPTSNASLYAAMDAEEDAKIAAQFKNASSKSSRG